MKGTNPLKQARERFREQIKRVKLHQTKKTDTDKTIELLKGLESMFEKVKVYSEQLNVFQ